MCFKKKKKVVRSLTEIFVELLRDPQKPFASYWSVTTGSIKPIVHQGHRLSLLADRKDKFAFGISFDNPLLILIFDGGFASAVEVMLEDPLFRSLRRKVKKQILLPTSVYPKHVSE